MEYPKAVYPGGTFDPELRDDDGQVLDYRIVNSQGEEAAANADGYFEFGKGQAQGPSELERLRAEAQARGIAIKGNWGVKKLREVLA